MNSPPVTLVFGKEACLPGKEVVKRLKTEVQRDNEM